MVRRSALIVILAVSLLAPRGCCEAVVDKARMLTQLTQAAKGQLAGRASAIATSFPNETAQLALDLICYRWAARASGMRADVRNIGPVISALTGDLNDQTVTWAGQIFASTQQGRTVTTLPPREDERVSQLSELYREYETAADYKESSPIQAANALTTVLELCQKLRFDLCEGLVLKELGDHYLYDVSRYRQAEVCYSRAAWRFSAYNCIESCAVVYDELGTLNAEMGRYSAATQNYKLAAQQWVLLSGSSSAAYRHAGLEYMKAGAAQRAAGNAEKAMELMTAYGLDMLRTWAHATKSYSELVANLLKVAEIYRERGSVTKSLDLLQEAKRASISQGDQLLIARTYGELAKGYAAADQSLNVREAARKREQALKVAAREGAAALKELRRGIPVPEKTRQKLFVSAERGAKAYRELNNQSNAAEIWEEMAAIYVKLGLVEEQVAAMRALAAISDQQGDDQRSLDMRRRAAMAAMKANRKALAAEVVQDMVQGFIRAGDLQNALEGLTELAPIIASSGNVRRAAQVLEARGVLLARNGQYGQAANDFKEAQARYLSQVGDPWAAGETAIKLASAQNLAGMPDDAIETLRASLDEIEAKYSQENLDPSTNPDRGDLTMKLYGDLAAAYVRRGKKDDAEKLLAKTRRYTWLPELLAQMENDPDPAVAQFAARVEIIGPPVIPDHTPAIPGKNSVLADNWAGFAEACWMLARQYPSAYNALPVNPLDLFRYRMSLPKNGAVIEYMLTDSSMYVFIGGFGKSICREIGIRRAETEKLVSDLRRVLKGCEQSLSSGIPIPPVSDWRETAFLEIKPSLLGLYDQLLGPIMEDVEERELLVFVLPEELAGLPMHSLIVPDRDYPPRFLVESHEIGYLSEGMLERLVAKDSRGIDASTDRLAIFADPEGNLPGAQKEATVIRGVYFNSQWYIGNRATASNFARECERAGIIHVAAHYRIDPNPSKFELLLAPDRDSDGRITIDNLCQIANPGLGLVVLSACNSIASSDPISSGPSRAAEVFSMAGAKSVLGGLWKVSDEAAAQIMGDFYRSLGKGRSRTEALKRAQVAMIESKEFAHPFYWACFAVYGNPW